MAPILRALRMHMDAAGGAMPETRKRRKGATQGAKRGPAAEAKPTTPRLEDRTRVELYEMARRLDIAGSAEMSKTELVEAIRRR